MRTIGSLAILCGTALLLTASAMAQAEKTAEVARSAPPPKFYHLDFVVKEVEAGKVMNSRSYSVVAGGTRIGLIRTGSRVPIPVQNSGVNYMDVGVKIDCSGFREVDGQLALFVAADLTGFIGTNEPNSTLPPIVRQVRWDSDVIVPFRKPTLIYSADDAASKRTTQFELTVYPVK